jgi:magnesium chelatase family protein
LPEFDRHVLEVLREPLESGTITISRAARQSCFPARVQLLAAMNPCPCGYLGDSSGRCRCTPEQVQRYRSRISGPLLDRIDLQIEVPNCGHRLFDRESMRGEPSATVRARVEAARDRQLARRGRINAMLTTRELEEDCPLTVTDEALLRHAGERLQLSMRAIHRVLRVARTIADLDGSDRIVTGHLTEALSYRRTDTRGP